MLGVFWNSNEICPKYPKHISAFFVCNDRNYMLYYRMTTGNYYLTKSCQKVKLNYENR